MSVKKSWIFGCMIFCGFVLLFVPNKNYQREISGKILRFHVVANSNSMEDQALKLEVRDRVIDYLSEPLSDCGSRMESEEMVRSLLPKIENVAQEYVRSKGYDYEVQAAVGEQYFPVKTYGDMTFPRGYYEALTIDIGSGRGRNWWCVLFPNLCFTDAVTAGVPGESRELLENELNSETYESLYEGEEVQIRFKLGEFLGGFLQQNKKY